jgi:hypothetical protein
MPNVDAIITPSQRLSQSMTDANRPKFNFALQDFLMGRKPDFWVYLFNIGEQEHFVYRPPLLANLKISGCPRGTRYVVAARFPHPLPAPQGSVDSDELTIQMMDTRRFAMDIVNPDNLGFDQNSVINNPSNIGNDLGKKGVFWATEQECTFADNDKEHAFPIPPARLLEDAKKRMEKHYKNIVEKANAVQSSAPGDLPALLSPEHHIAADYLGDLFGMQFQWHAKMARLEECELCGARVKAGVAFHRTEEGGICVRDWERAVKAGARTRAQAYEATEDEKYAPKVKATKVEPAPESEDV